MAMDLNFRSKLVKNARSQVRQSHQPRVSVYKGDGGQATLVEEKQQKIERDVENLRKRHAKILSK